MYIITTRLVGVRCLRILRTKKLHIQHFIFGPPLVMWLGVRDKGHIDAVMMNWEGSLKHKSHCPVYVLLFADNFFTILVLYFSFSSLYLLTV